MNRMVKVFLFELKIQMKSCIIWLIFLLATLLLFMNGIYPVFEASFDDVLRVINGFPPAFASAFGFDIKSMFGLGGFYGFAFGYISLVGAIMAISLSVSSFSMESRSKCVDFLLTKPISREMIFAGKFLSCLTMVILVNIIYSIVCFMILSQGDAAVTVTFWATASLFFTQLVFLSFGTFFAIFAKKIRSVSGIATAFGFGAFILSALVNIFNEDAIRYIAPLKYFDPTALYQNGSIELPYALTGIFLTVICLCFAFVLFMKRDQHQI